MSLPHELLTRIQAAGGNAEARGSRLLLTAPKPLPEDLLEALRSRKEEVLAALRGEFPAPGPPSSPAEPGEGLTEATRRILGMTLAEFEQEGRPLEVQVPWLPDTLWFVPTHAHAADLVAKGVARGRIWTAHELQDLMSTPGLTKERVRTVARVKAEFEGTLIDTRRAGDDQGV